MTWRLLILDKAEADLRWFRQKDRRCYVKAFDLILEISKDPAKGTGRPERLKHLDREVWSRRISREHRLVYVVYQDEDLIEIVSCKSHYESLS